MNLIDRDMIPFQMKKFHKENGEIHYRRIADYDDVMDMPLVDAEERKWCYMARVDDYRWKCMTCGTTFAANKEISTTNFNFCPHCGAKVKLEVG